MRKRGISATNERRWAAALTALDANLLVALDALLQESSVTRAARRMGVTQSAMSQTLARLRRQFDDPILVKAGRRMEPSDFGRRIGTRLHRAVTELEAVVADRPEYDPATATNRFVIATVDYLAILLAAPLRRRFLDEAPGVQLAVFAVGAGSTASRLAEGHVHLYVGVHGRTEGALSTEPLHNETLRVLVGPDNPLARGKLTVARYCRAPHVLVSPRREAGSIVDRGLATAGHSRTVAVEVPFFGMLPELLSASDLVATVPSRIAAHFAERHGLVTRPPPLELPSFPICMAWHPAFATDPAQQWFRRLIATLL